MKKQPSKNTKPVSSKKLQAPSWGRIDYILIILAYAIVPVATPIMEAFDANGPKFLALAALNLVTYLYMFTRKDLAPGKDFYKGLFRNRIGIVYLLLLLVALLSFFKAINIYESIINFSKLFTIFSAAYILSILFRADRVYLKYLAIALSFMLLFDCFTVFYHMLQYIGGTVPSIYMIKSVYSNKNILTAALFVKIPFALWLFSFEKGWLKQLGFFTLFIGLLATFFMSTRAFYLGMIVLTAFYGGYLLIRYLRQQQKSKIGTLAGYMAAIVIAFLIFEVTQKYLYPKANDSFGYNTDFFARISTVGGGEGGRNLAWARTIRLIRENPVLGVGIGNWKIVALKYENLVSRDYTYMYKNHNDFLEVTSELGIFGGILFLGLFVLTGLLFIQAFIKKDAPESSFQYLFLPAFGVFAYSIDAFFNFPADRPEIGALFAVFIGAGMAFSPSWNFRRPSAVHKTSLEAASPAGAQGGTNQGRSSLSSFISAAFSFLLLLGMIGSVYVFVQNYRSIKLQRMVKSEMAAGKLTLPSEMFMTGFPSFPTVSLECEPIAVHKARYLINESKFQQAIDILKSDRSSPYDTRQEFFISMAYFQLGQVDSSFKYSVKVFEQKPLFYNNTSNLCRSMESKGDHDGAMKVITTYLDHDKSNADAWMFASAMYDNRADYKMACATIDSGAKYLPGDTSILKQQGALHSKMKIKPYEALYVRALESFNQKKYADAIKYFSDFIDKEPGLPEAYDFRAFSYFFINEHKKSIADIERYFALGARKPNLLNLRGVNYHLLGNDEAACKDFKKAIDGGDRDARSNYEKFCKTKTN